MQLGCIRILAESDRGESIWLAPEWDERHHCWCMMRAASRAYFKGSERNHHSDDSKRLVLRLNGVDVSTRRFVERVEDCERDISIRLLERHDRFEVALVDRHRSLAQLEARFLRYRTGDQRFINRHFGVETIRLEDREAEPLQRAACAETVLLQFVGGGEALLTLFTSSVLERRYHYSEVVIRGYGLHLISPYMAYTVENLGLAPLDVVILRVPLTPDFGRRQRVRREPVSWELDISVPTPEKLLLPVHYDNMRLSVQTIDGPGYELAQCDSPAHCILAAGDGLTVTTASADRFDARRGDLCMLMTPGEPYMLENRGELPLTLLIITIDPHCQTQ